MDSQVARSMAQTSQIPQQAQATLDANNMDVLQQLQQRMMLERSMNSVGFCSFVLKIVFLKITISDF
jgi:hypothetical protein